MGPTNSYLAGEVLPTTQCYVAREEFGKKGGEKKNSFKAFLGKAEKQRRSVIKSCELYNIHVDMYY